MDIAPLGADGFAAVGPSFRPLDVDELEDDEADEAELEAVVLVLDEAVDAIELAWSAFKNKR